MGDGRTEKVTFTCTPDLKAFLLEWAVRERRSLSNLVEGIVTEAAEAQSNKSFDLTRSKAKKKKEINQHR
jgi:hypothetical protein